MLPILAILAILPTWGILSLYAAMWLHDVTASYPPAIQAAAGIIWLISCIFIPAWVALTLNEDLRL